MTWYHTNTLTLNSSKELRAELGLQIEILKAEIESQKQCVREHKLRLHHATDQWTRIRDAKNRPHSWLLYQLTGGNTELKKHFENLMHDHHGFAESNYNNRHASLQREETYLDNARGRLERAVMQHRMIRDQADIVVSKDMLDTFLRDNAHYTPGSLQLSYNNDPLTYRVTFSLHDIIATNPRGNNPIVIPPLRIDFYIYPNGEHDLVVRNDIDRPYWTDRYKGYSEIPLLHPHMTSGTTLCLGDFGEGVTEAISEGDLVTAITTLTMFFQQYDHDDSAGAYHDVWPDADEDRHIADYADA